MIFYVLSTGIGTVLWLCINIQRGAVDLLLEAIYLTSHIREVSFRLYKRIAQTEQEKQSKVKQSNDVRINFGNNYTSGTASLFRSRM